jgi:hypothetical protein
VLYSLTGTKLITGCIVELWIVLVRRPHLHRLTGLTRELQFAAVIGLSDEGRREKSKDKQDQRKPAHREQLLNQKGSASDLLLFQVAE